MAAASVAATVKKGSFWRLAGLTYLDQLNIATTALRKVLKEPHRTEALGKAQRHADNNNAWGSVPAEIREEIRRMVIEELRQIIKG